MSDAEHADGTRKKHRHELGQEDHGSIYAARTTRGIQVVLGLWIALTFVLVGWAIYDAQGAKMSSDAPAAAAEPATRSARLV